MSKYGTAADVRATMREHYSSKEWALMFEVSNDAGFSRSRSADAVAMNLWPSRGLRIHGFEIKVSRSDLIKELTQPEKCEAIAKYCDHWWLVGPREIFADDVLAKIPPSWGIMVYVPAVGNGTGKPAKTARLSLFKDAPFLGKPDDRETLPRGFVACLLRRASEADAADIEAIIEKRIQPVKDQIEDRIKQGIQNRISHNTHALKILEDLQKETGIDFGRYGLSDGVASAINAVVRSQIFSKYGSAAIESLSKRLKEFAQGIDELASYGKPEGNISQDVLVERPQPEDSQQAAA
ncbi:MAG: hypothetical protein V4607_01910 [Pseudomonadota bacterium]